MTELPDDVFHIKWMASNPTLLVISNDMCDVFFGSIMLSVTFEDSIRGGEGDA